MVTDVFIESLYFSNAVCVHTISPPSDLRSKTKLTTFTQLQGTAKSISSLSTYTQVYFATKTHSSALVFEP